MNPNHELQDNYIIEDECQPKSSSVKSPNVEGISLSLPFIISNHNQLFTSIPYQNFTNPMIEKLTGYHNFATQFTNLLI